LRPVERAAFHGTIGSGDAEAVTVLLQDWLKTEKLDIDSGRVGVEIVYEEDGLYVYCHEAGTDPGVPPFYLLEGRADGTLDETSARLQELMKLCRGRDIECSAEYVALDEADEELGEEFSVKLD
jgi:hypothetical protein